MKKWLRRGALALLLGILLIAAAGAAWEAVARARAAADFPPPGKLVDIGGRRLHLDCRGSGAPTVVFESGLDEKGALSWALVHEPVAKITRACAYSRPGIMWSDAHAAPELAAAYARDLHAALKAAGEPPPLVLVGHSLGGPYSMNYTKAFPDDVAGLVLVDASHPDQMARLNKVMTVSPKDQLPVLRALDLLAWTGATRLAMAADQGRLPAQPPQVRAAAVAYAPHSLAALIREMESLDQTLAQAGELRTLGDRPLYVLTAAKPFPPAVLKTLQMTEQDGARMQELWTVLQAEQAAWSSRSRQISLPDAAHYIQFDRPDAVIAAVQWVVEQVRGPAP